MAIATVTDISTELAEITTKLRNITVMRSGSLGGCLGRVVGINTMIANALAVAIPSFAVERFLRGSRDVAEAV